MRLDPLQAMWGGEGPEWTRPAEARMPEVRNYIAEEYDRDRT